jgi:hypothetical protein
MATKEKAEKKHALYLMPFENGQYSRAQLVHADDVEDRLKEGWREPIGQKANGEEWNAEDDLDNQDCAAESAKKNAERQAKKDAKKAEELEAARKVQEALPKPQDRPDFKVEVVTPEKAPKGK